MNIRTRTLRPLTLAVLSSCLMAGALSSAVAQTTTLGTRGTLSQANAPTTTNPYANWSTYDRKADYPRSISLPLQYITTSKGDKLSVRCPCRPICWACRPQASFRSS